MVDTIETLKKFSEHEIDYFQRKLAGLREKAKETLKYLIEDATKALNTVEGDRLSVMSLNRLSSLQGAVENLEKINHQHNIIGEKIQYMGEILSAVEVELKKETT